MKKRIKWIFGSLVLLTGFVLYKPGECKEISEQVGKIQYNSGLNLQNPGYQNQTVDLSGTWQFDMDSMNVGITEKWFLKEKLNYLIQLPGCMQEQGYGEIPDIETSWWGFGTIEQVFDESPWLAKYKTKDNFKIQNWLLPKRHYIGAAWYARDFTVLPEWNNQQVSLHLERCHWETQMWLDGKSFGTKRSMATPQEYDLSGVGSGKHRLVIRVDNSMIVNIGKQPHSNSEQTAGTWNGIIGDITIEAKQPIGIEDVQIFPNLNTKSARLYLQLQIPDDLKEYRWELSAEANGYNNGNSHQPKPAVFSGSISASQQKMITVDYYMGEDVKLWDEFDPNLYRLNLKLELIKDKKTYHSHKEMNFGFREFGISGRQFTMNDIPTFLRGNTDCAEMPKTGYPPMDVESWQKVWKTYKTFGLNMARFHSWCPPEAAFIAADEIGIYLAPEVGEWSQVNSKEQFDFFTEESLAILKTYGNHPCFIQMGLGNEMSGKEDFFERLIEKWKSLDTRHKYTIKANSPSNPNNVDFEIVRGVGEGRSIKMRYQGGWPPTPEASYFISHPPQTSMDWSEAVFSREKPLIQHESAQICAYPSVINEMKKYTGYLQPTYLEIALDQLKKRGMLDQLDEFVEASGKWQVELTREEFEAAYRTPQLAGLNWLSLADFTGQNTAPVGFTDAFYDPKPYVKPEEVRHWNAPTILLARLEKRVFSNKDILAADILLTHYGKYRLKLDDLKIQLKKENGAILKDWTLPQNEFPQGSAQHLGKVICNLDAIEIPEKLVLEVSSKKGNLFNEWNIWVFPERSAKPFPENIMVTHRWDNEAKRALKKGKTVLLLPQKELLKGQLPVCFTNYYWTSIGENKGQSSAAGILINSHHPLFYDFPTESHANWQWWDMLTQCRPMILDSYNTENPWPANYHPIIQPIDTWKINRKLALVVEAKFGKGKLMICSIDIENDLENRIAAKQFRNSMIEYLSGEDFNPQTIIDDPMVNGLFDVNQDNKEPKNSGMNLPTDG